LQYLDEEDAQSLPPHSTQAEEAVLGSVLKNGLAIADVLGFISPSGKSWASGGTLHLRSATWVRSPPWNAISSCLAAGWRKVTQSSSSSRTRMAP
jgi:hypothetical protein